MDLNEAQEILKQAGYLCEFRDSSNPLDKETEHTSWHHPDEKVSWNNAKASYRTNISGEDTTKAANKEARMANELIAKVDEVCNKFEDYDYFVKRYDTRTIQVRRTEESDTGVPFLQISVNGEDDGSFTFCCGIGSHRAREAVSFRRLSVPPRTPRCTRRRVPARIPPRAGSRADAP